MLEWGPHEERLAALPVPAPALLRKPALWAENAAPWAAFHALTQSRQVGLGISPISVADVLAYVQLAGIESVDDRLRLLEQVQACDRVFMAHARKRQAAKGEKAPA